MGRGRNERPTDNDWNKFYNKEYLKPEQKIEALCRFLLGTNESMGDIGLGMFGENGGFTVSMIHRCYNINTNFYGHKGRYAPSSKFCREYGEVFPEDIEEFVYKYPQGITDTNQVGTGIELEEFLKERIAQRQSYGYDYDDDSDYEENDFYNDVSYQNRQNNRNASRNTFNVSQYNNRESDSSYNRYSRSSLDDIDIAMVGTSVAFVAGLFIVLALLFNWFHWRSKLLVFIYDYIQLAWLFGMMIFLLRTIMRKVDFMNEKTFLGKVVTFFVIGLITYLVVSLFGYVCYYFSMK
ncbi:MAG: hypothetical protein NC177_04890 [Ruminococcus flavefaciens]|nr:hypothetical protein [Ruminococcus flavefaciens]